MRRLVTFDTWVESYQVSDAAGQLRALPGVKSLEVLEGSGSPRICLLLETEDAEDANVAVRLNEAFTGEYQPFVSNVKMMTFRKIG